MFLATAVKLRCPAQTAAGDLCGSALAPEVEEELRLGPAGVPEVRWGSLLCKGCQAEYPILEGVAILVDDVGLFLVHHAKGIAKIVPDDRIPKPFLSDYLEAKAEIALEHIEEDLEADRVTALYLMNHYLRVAQTADSQTPWWHPEAGEPSPLIDRLVREHWDSGPFSKIKDWVTARTVDGFDAIELGCGVGGLYPELHGSLRSYLGVDSSFASIALARHYALGVPYGGSNRIPEDLLKGPVSRAIEIHPTTATDGSADFIVGDLGILPVVPGRYNLAISLNAIDMLDDPGALPVQQRDLLTSGGFAIQSCPYIWHESVARQLREVLPENRRDSASAVEWLYEQAGLKLEERLAHVPWLFFKHVRQLEIYSVHMLLSRRG